MAGLLDDSWLLFFAKSVEIIPFSQVMRLYFKK